MTISPDKVLFKNDHFIVIDKDFDVKMNSTDPTDVITVAKQLAKTFPDTVDNSVLFGYRFQQRLDHATSGVVCISLDKKSASQLGKAFIKRDVLKHYVALVHGHVEPKYSLINVPLCRRDKDDESDPYKMNVATSENVLNKKVKDCQTFVVKLETGAYSGNPATKLLLIPFSGRTHQLRVHCKHIGHLIVGDFTYSNRQDTEPFRMMLHSLRLRVILKDQTLDIQTKDPFTCESDPRWKAETVFTTYEDCVSTLYHNFNFQMPIAMRHYNVDNF